MATENPIRMSGSNERWSNSVPNRSGSAPPSMEGSFRAVDNLLSRQGSSGYNNSSFQKQEPLKHNLNRTPSPPVYYPAAQYHQFVDNRVGSRFYKVKSPVHLSQGALSTHKEVSEDESFQQPSVISFSDMTNAVEKELRQVWLSLAFSSPSSCFFFMLQGL